MKKIWLLLSLTLASTSLFAQDFDKIDPSPMDATYFPQKAVKQYMESNPEKAAALAPKIKVIYSRPQKKGREIFGKLVPYNKLWRTGANEIPEITFFTDVEIGGKTVSAGKYALAVLPTKDKWTLYVSSFTDAWGVYDYDGAKNVAEVTGTPTISKKEVEAFSMALYEKSANVIHLKMGWDKTVTEFPITLK